MHTVICLMIKYIKKQIDKIYYSQYNPWRETLIREMFPWIINVWEYKEVEIFFKNMSIQQTSYLIKTIWAFYWGEVNRLTLEGKFDKIERLQGLIDFTVFLKDYEEYALSQQRINH